MTSPDIPEPEGRPIVIGAGVAGLSAALALAEAGLRPLVLEADASGPGGRFAGRPPVVFEQSGRSWSFPAEHGVHGLWEHYRNLRGLLEHHSIRPPLIRADRQDWVYGRHNGVFRAEVGRRLQRSFLPAPFHYLALLANPRFLAMLGIGGILRVPWVGITLLTMLAVDPMREGESLAGRQVRELLFGWPPQLHAFAAALSRSGLATGPGDAPLGGFIALYRFYSLLRRDAIGHDYIAGDPGEHVIDPMAAAIERLGGRVVSGVRATGIERTETGAWEVRCETVGSPDHPGLPSGPLIAPEVILATDAPGARALLEAAPALAGDTAGLRWTPGQANAVVRLWFSGRPRDGGESGMFGGDFVLDNFFWLHRLQPAFIEWSRATGGSAAEAHIYGPPRLLAESDAALLGMAVRDFSHAFPELRGTRVHVHLQRNPPTHTLFSIGTTHQHLGVQTPWQGLFCCGDWVRDEAPPLFLERACVTGLKAAGAVLTARGLPAPAVAAYPRPEPVAALLEWLLRGIRRAMIAVLQRR